ncbi:MAG: aspartate dehydrogenase [Bacillota bacterium]|nr:aspartate dehydrogenase [Bacillota bacterium]
MTGVPEMKVGILGCGTIGSYVLDAVLAGKVENARVVAVAGRSKGRAVVEAAGIEWLTDPAGLVERNIDVVVEAASHEAVEMYGASILRAGVDLIPLSLGAMVNQDLLESLIIASAEAGSRLHLPSGGIGGLDALQAALVSGVSAVSMTTRKPPRAWKGIPFVETLGLDLEGLAEPALLYEGPARDCVKKFPQNINIAAALSLAGVGFDKTMIRIMADPQVKSNTHEILVEAETGRFRVILENVPVPENPKTTYLACASAVAALRRVRSLYRAGT